MAALSLTGCGSSDGSDSGDNAGGSDPLTVYLGQHEDLGQALADAFEAETGIQVELRPGSDAEMANQIVEEGQSSPADLYISEEPDPIAQIDAAGLLAPVDPDTLAAVDGRFNPSSGSWVAYAARSRAIFYDPSLIDEADLPASILDLADPEWKGRFAYAPSAAFVTTVTYLIQTIGEDETLAWLKGIRENGANEETNGMVRDSVEAGLHDFGLSNHYYWYVLADEQGGTDKLRSKVHYLKGQDAGGLVLASGAGVLASSDQPEEAARFLAWLVAPDGGQAVVASASPQFPVAPGVESTYDLVSIEELDPPEFDQGSLSDIAKARELMIESGIG